MSSVFQNVIKPKVGLLNLAAELGNVSRAWRVMGFSLAIEQSINQTRRLPLASKLLLNKSFLCIDFSDTEDH